MHTPDLKFFFCLGHVISPIHHPIAVIIFEPDKSFHHPPCQTRLSSGTKEAPSPTTIRTDGPLQPSLHPCDGPQCHTILKCLIYRTHSPVAFSSLLYPHRALRSYNACYSSGCESLLPGNRRCLHQCRRNIYDACSGCHLERRTSCL